MDETTKMSVFVSPTSEPGCEWSAPAAPADVPPEWSFGTVWYNEPCSELYIDGRLVPMQQPALRVLSELLRAGDEPVSREELLEHLRDGTPVVDGTALTGVIGRLRDALRGSGARVVTVEDSAYRLDRNGGLAHHVLYGLQEMEIEDLLAVPDEQIEEEARCEGEDLHAVASSFKARVRQSLQSALKGVEREDKVGGDGGAAEDATASWLQTTAPAEPDPPPTYTYTFGATVLDEAARELRIHDQRVDMQPLLLKLLSELLRASGDPVTVAGLRERVWGEMGQKLSDANVTQAIMRLRRELRDDGVYLQRMPGRGYRFDFRGSGTVRRGAADADRGGAPRLHRGAPVPHRPEFFLQRPLGASQGTQMWRARDAAQRERRVLKIATDSVGLVSLQHELAILTHLQNTLGERSDIARLHSWNLDQTPCLLELQDGGDDLAAWAAQDAHLPEMSIDDRVELFCQVAEVLRALHSVGVVYVDLRPRNILVTGQPRRWRVRLANFAASRVSAPLDRVPGQSRSGVPVTEPFDTSVTPGALLYRAPELARGEPPDRQTDIYALGVLLYQLVAGDFSRTPSPGWERDVEDAALREDIAAATDLDPAQRLSSVEALVRRLHGLSRRRRGRRAAGVLASGSGAGLWQVLRISRRVSLGVGLCVAALCALLAGWQVMRYRATQSVATDGIAALMELYKATDQNGGGVLQHAEVLDAVLRGRFVRDPVIRAALLLEVGSAHFRRSELTEAEAAQREAVLLLERAQGPYHPATLMAEYDLVRTLDARQQYDEAGSLLALADQHAGDRQDGSPELRLLALWTRGGHELMLQGAARALSQYEQLERLQQRWKPGDLIWRLRAQGGLAACLLLMGQNHEALLLIEDLIRPEYSIDKVGLRDWAQLRMQHARALANLGRQTEAAREAEEVLAEVKASGGPGSYVAGLVWDDLAGVRRVAGMFREALDAERQGYQIMKEHMGARGQATLLMRGRIGELEYLADEPARAVETLQEVHGEMVSALGDGSPLTQLAAFHLAAALSDSGRAGEAAPVAARLNPHALAAAEAAVHWDRRLMALDADIRIRTGRDPGAARPTQQAAAQQSPQGVPDWVLAHLQHERISSGAGHGSG